MGKLTAIAGASMAIVSFTVMDRNLAVGLAGFHIFLILVALMSCIKIN